MIDDLIVARLVSALDGLAASAAVQRASDFPPEELRLVWEDSFVLFESRADEEPGHSIPDADNVRAFDQYLWALPAEPDPMWHRDNLVKHPWPEIRRKASELRAIVQPGIGREG